MGYTPAGEHWLLDLERVGAVALSGDSKRCLDLARFLAAELAHNTWSEMLQVTLAGFGEELAGINPDRLICTDNVDKAIAAGLPSTYSWTLGIGLLITLVWLYLEILRLLGRLRSE